MKLTNYVLILLFLPAGNALSGHLIGGDFSYKCLGDNKYEINLTIYRNCECNGEPNCADFDSQAKVTIYNGEMEFVDTLLMNLNVEIEREEIKPQTYELCLREAPDVCVERSTGYSEIITLPPSITGYSLIYMRCCRNRSINNLVNPSKQGNTYLLEIPPSDVAACNSSPVFKNLPPIILCAGYQFSFNHSATDIDGDRLEYSLCEPYDYPLNPDQPSQGGNGPIIQSGQLGPPPPYDAIVWTDSFSASNQIGGNPEMTIDRNTGVLTAFPDNIGRYVIGICVSEYRNGILLSTTIRDYQLKIVDCDVVEAEVESTSIDANGNFI